MIDCSWEAKNLLPGWNELSGWSVLINGRPVEGQLVINPDDPATLILRFPLWPGQELRNAGTNRTR